MASRKAIQFGKGKICGRASVTKFEKEKIISGADNSNKVNVENNKRSKIELHIHNNDSVPDVFRMWKIIFNRWPAAVIVAIGIAITLRIELQSLNLNKDQSVKAEDVNNKHNHNSVTENVNDNLYENQTYTNYNGWDILKIVPRMEWIAEPARDKLDVIKQPVPQVVITHTATEACTTRSKCVFLVRMIQNFHTEGKEFFDIGYNFLVGGDGYVYQGRGWDHVGAFAKGFNNVSIGIAMIGTFITRKPTEKQISAVKILIQEGVLLKKVSKNYKLLPHCNVSSTTSPGAMLFRELKTWPHFSETPLR